MLKFSLHDRIILALDEQRYFDPSEGTREVDLLSKEDMRRKLGIVDGFSETYINGVFRENKIIPLKTLVGTYVGSRNNIIKILPYYGLSSPEAEYFIIPIEHIKNTSKIKLVEE